MDNNLYKRLRDHLQFTGTRERLMKKYILILIIIFLSNTLAVGQVKKILFLGNSYTAAYNLPEKVSMLASSFGDSVFFDSNTPGGYRLLNHATNTTTLAKISQEDWNYVVIQAQSQEPSWPPSQVATEVLPYATMFQKSPVGAQYFAGLPESDALFLQQIAEDVVLGEEYNFTFYDTYTNINYDLGWENWFDFGNITFAGFSFSGIETTYSFFDNSLNAETYFWDFGDGDTSTLQNPLHTYSETGNYIVTQSVGNPCFDDNAHDTINVVINLAENITDQFIVSVYPNPGNGIFEMVIKSQGLYDKVFYEIFDANGKMVNKGEVTEKKGIFHKQIDLSSLVKGFYYLRIYLGDDTINKTLIIR